MRRKAFKVLILAGFCFLYLTSTAFAAQENVWHKGSYYSKYVDGSYAGKETVVTSAGAYYTSSGGWGMNRVRVWARISNVQSYYDSVKQPVYPSQCSARTAYIRLRSSTSDPMYNIYNTTPQDANGGSTFLEELFYDVLGYVYVPDSIARAVVNGFTSSVDVTGTSGDKEIVINGNLPSSVDLPNSVLYYHADKYGDGSGSGINTSVHGRFWYNLVNTPATFYASGKIKYVYTYYKYGLYTIYPLSSPATVNFTVG